MNSTKRTFLGIIAAVLFQAVASCAATQPPRRVLSLDGTWQIAEGKMDQAPVTFERTVPVPGLVSLATPALADPPGPKVAERHKVPQKDPKRDAFWYGRSFRLDQPVPAVALLKIHKAMFGTRVILNGHVLGDQLPSFTPGYFNAKAALKTGENELLIRVGADRDAVGPAIPSGFDFEKEHYIPGIFDSVELILSGTPHFTQVQQLHALPVLRGQRVQGSSLAQGLGSLAPSAREGDALELPPLLYRFPARGLVRHRGRSGHPYPR